jgi:hypothetical protein
MGVGWTYTERHVRSIYAFASTSNIFVLQFTASFWIPAAIKLVLARWMVPSEYGISRRVHVDIH